MMIKMKKVKQFKPHLVSREIMIYYGIKFATKIKMIIKMKKSKNKMKNKNKMV